jgi:hypothetical protein
VSDVEGLLLIAACGIGIAYDRFLALVDAEGEAADTAAVEGDEAGQNARVEILKEKFGRTPVVPAKPLLPYFGLGFEQGAKLARGEVPKVEDLELGRDWQGIVVLLELCRAYRNFVEVGRLGTPARFPLAGVLEGLTPICTDSAN